MIELSTPESVCYMLQLLHSYTSNFIMLHNTTLWLDVCLPSYQTKYIGDAGNTVNRSVFHALSNGGGPEVAVALCAKFYEYKVTSSIIFSHKPTNMPTLSSTTTDTTNALLLLTIINHASWSTLHVAARYLQVYAQPITFDSPTLLSSTKGFAALFLFIFGIASSWVDENYYSAGNKYSRLQSVNDTLNASASCLVDGNDKSKSNNKNERAEYDTLIPKEQIAAMSNHSTTHAIQDEDTEIEDGILLQRKRLLYALLFAVVSTTRASSNIASAKFTHPYNISEYVCVCQCCIRFLSPT